MIRLLKSANVRGKIVAAGTCLSLPGDLERNLVNAHNAEFFEQELVVEQPEEQSSEENSDEVGDTDQPEDESSQGDTAGVKDEDQPKELNSVATQIEGEPVYNNSAIGEAVSEQPIGRSSRVPRTTKADTE